MLLALAILVILIPVSVKLFKEDILGDVKKEESEEWMTRLRTVVTVALTLVLLVLVVTWIKSPETLEVRQTSVVPPSNGTNITGNETLTTEVQLNPFVESFFTIYAVVIGFYFGASAAENIAGKLKPPPSSSEETSKE